MFENILEKEERGQVGIGTLIVFIAMVLVAAIAAGVLINTAGFLQTQAEATGQESTQQVSDRIEVVSSVGIVDSSGEGLESINVSVTNAAGADQIDLNETTIQVVGPEGQENLVANASTDINSIDDLEEGEFGVQDSDGEWVEGGSEAVIDNDRFTIIISPDASTSLTGFGQGDEAQLDIVAPSSATTSETLNAPDLFGEEGEAVIL
ncbi:Archaeal flagellin [Halalkaliarchaeum sp. AArc-CO]|uniref:archaellin/type IV pilin N-terminal domain-containing protein n=1 Tax=Halalkaliarchaeum sp. AArc-CO TaxID=2866381 RepID=UPI00217D0A36|nr:archaellin/type IV pilin N-terminal domain-containing protein [Halalkaliarchaeum sp. AArc-CO]UWG52260.1 Archaeal flagellin [Halalkaliarchaeum sp. AArc-CO]